MDTTLSGRLPIAALKDVQQFLESAEHLKALHMQLRERRCRTSRLELSLEQQISVFTQHCGTLAAASPRLAELWTQTQAELSSLAIGAAPSPPPPPVAGAANGGCDGSAPGSAVGVCNWDTSGARRNGTT